MKKSILYILCAGASLLMAFPACTNLDEDVYDKIPADSFGSSETEIYHMKQEFHPKQIFA